MLSGEKGNLCSEAQSFVLSIVYQDRKINNCPSETTGLVANTHFIQIIPCNAFLSFPQALLRLECLFEAKTPKHSFEKTPQLELWKIFACCLPCDVS